MFSLGLAQPVPMTRYFPDNALATLELNDLQEAVDQTGQFGEETIRTLTQLAGTSLQELSDELSRESGMGALSNLGVRALLGSLRDATVALYSGPSGEPLFLAAAKVGQFGVIGQLLRAGVNDSLKNPRAARLREGNFVAIKDGDLWFGMEYGLVYLSSNPDLLRGYLRRLRGQNLPVLTRGTAYKAVMDGVGPGWARYFFNLGGIAQWLSRSPDAREVPPRVFAVLRTLNLHGAAQRITAAGVENRTLSILNPGGGDPELFRLLTYSPERLELTTQLPAQTNGAAVVALDTAGWLKYFGSWADLALAEGEARAEEVEQFKQVLGELEGHLGTEFGISSSANGIRTLTRSAMLTGGLDALSDDPVTEFVSGLTSALDANVLFAQVKDGPAALEVLESAIRTQLEGLSATSTRQTLERIELLGNPALHLNIRINTEDGGQGRGSSQNITPRQALNFDYYLVAKGNVLWLGGNREDLEAALRAPALAADPAFNAQRWPARPAALNFALPLRLTAEQVNELIDTFAGQFDPEAAQQIPQNLRQIAVNWVVNWSSRNGVTAGHSTVRGNRVQSYSLSEFRWGR